MKDYLKRKIMSQATKVECFVEENTRKFYNAPYSFVTCLRTIDGRMNATITNTVYKNPQSLRNISIDKFFELYEPLVVLSSDSIRDCEDKMFVRRKGYPQEFYVTKTKVMICNKNPNNVWYLFSGLIGWISKEDFEKNFEVFDAPWYKRIILKLKSIGER